MPYVCLLLSGAALLINGLATLGHLPRRDAAVLSLAVGILQLVLGVVLSPGPSAGGPLTASGMFLFGLTYLYVGLDFLLDLGSKGLGWFCGMVAFVGLLLAAAWLHEDPLLAVLWLGWSALWGLFFVSMALGLARVDLFTGWALVLTSQVTATVPAFLGLAGLWPRSPLVAAAAAALLAGLFVLAGILARQTLAAWETARTDAGAPGRAVRHSLASAGEESAR
ncbi:AmiS/UreI family transporter [Arthrobacter sp. SLBN-100]|uniref:AmiS/UreI family transporter n=1 Tax=Arthrobacter sp. SLBN-100 TaxID=2768450 RepID=UPI0011508C6B|nr:AmiS/UreI family transporter [Arthrobacter sp. SLBN-100]TQJ68324.1 AmiS/UreI family transporter [Arthrobacter sp. SLBN-100]